MSCVLGYRIYIFKEGLGYRNYCFGEYVRILYQNILCTVDFGKDRRETGYYMRKKLLACMSVIKTVIPYYKLDEVTRMAEEILLLYFRKFCVNIIEYI